MSWRGTWLSSVSNSMPQYTEFAASFNFFELNFDVRHASHATDLSQGKWALEHFLGLSGDFRGHYLMEPPDGTGYRRAYRDERHEFCFDSRVTMLAPSPQTEDDVTMAEEPKVPHTNNALMDAMFPVVAHLQQQRQAQSAPLPPGPYVLCAARGTNEFGSFVALGHARRTRAGTAAGLCPQAIGTASALDDGVELTLARRYVRDDDSRLHWPLSELLNAITLHPTRRSKVAPWEHSLPCRLPSDVIAADARRQEELANTMQDHDFSGGSQRQQQSFYEAEMARKRPRD